MIWDDQLCWMEHAEQCLYQCYSYKALLNSMYHTRSNAEVVSALTAASVAVADTPWIALCQIVDILAPDPLVSMHVASTCVHSPSPLMVGLNTLMVAPEFLGCVYEGQ